MFHKSVVFFFIFIFVHVHGQCRWKDGALPTVENGYRSSVMNLKTYSDDTAEGFYEVQCHAGYRLNEAIGGRIMCLESGEWSQPLPECISMGSCCIEELFDFIRKTEGIQVDRQKSFIYTNGVDDKRAIGESNITINCRDGYDLIAGSPLIVCTEQNTWTPFPQCVAIPSVSVPDPSSLRCPIDSDSWNIPNGYLSETRNLLVYSDNTANGSTVVSCSAGYTVDSTSRGVWTCNAGQWSPRPYCIKTARCEFSTLEDFVSDPSLNRGLGISSQLLSMHEDETNAILTGSFVNFKCNDGYANIDGNLNVTCTEDGHWTSFPACIAQDGSRTPGRCPWTNDALPTVENGYRYSIANLRAFSNGLASGYYDIACDLGYVLDPEIGARITCLETGQWSSPLPKCIFEGSCKVAELFDFIRNADGIEVDRSKSFIYTNGLDDDLALGGSNITITCRDGYTNIGGPSLITCTSSSTWSTFPQCVSTASSTTQPDVPAPTPSPRCAYDDQSWTFQNGYLSSTRNLIVYNDNTAEGYLEVSCSPGYAIDSTSQGVYTCNEGQWSPRPYCTQTNRCLLSDIQDFVSSPSLTRGLDISSQSLSTNPDEKNAILIGSSITFMCKTGYSNTDGNLHVTCNENGQWSQFPRCVADSA